LFFEPFQGLHLYPILYMTKRRIFLFLPNYKILRIFAAVRNDAKPGFDLQQERLGEGQWNPGAGGAELYHGQDTDGFTGYFGGSSPSSGKKGRLHTLAKPSKARAEPCLVCVSGFGQYGRVKIDTRYRHQTTRDQHQHWCRRLCPVHAQSRQHRPRPSSHRHSGTNSW